MERFSQKDVTVCDLTHFIQLLMLFVHFSPQLSNFIEMNQHNLDVLWSIQVRASVLLSEGRCRSVLGQEAEPQTAPDVAPCMAATSMNV